jgi:nitric oxide reductase NorD protein
VNLLSAPGIPNPLGDAIQKLLGMGRSGRDKNQGSAEIPAGKQRFGPVGQNARKGSLGRLLSAVLEPAPVVGARYPEWDCHKGAYRFDWCAVAEYDPADVESVSDNGATRSLLQRPLSRVGIEAERHRRQAEGDSLDLSALLDYETDRRHGGNPDPYIYESSRLTKRDLSVLVLLDCSGSTAEGSGGRVVFEEERRLAGDLTVALERLGDRVGTYGFYSRGKDAVRFLRVKNFNARFDAAAKGRLQSVQPSGFTRIGAAIRHAAHVLESQALAKNMVLLVIGDGLPYDDGYEDRYARADARQAINEAVLQGIGVAGIGIRSSTEPEVLEDVWSDASFRVIGQSGDIQRHLRGLLVNALSATRSNGRRRELVTEEHHGYLRSLHAARRSATNTYV